MSNASRSLTMIVLAASALFAISPLHAADAEGEIDLAEYRIDGEDSFLVDSALSYGDDDDRAVLKMAAGGSVGRMVDEIEAQLLYSRNIGGGFAALVGIRHEFRPHPHRTYAALGIEGEPYPGVAPEAYLFLSEEGDLLGEVKLVYDHEIAPRFVIQPRAAVHLSAQSVPDQELASGLTDLELGLRFRYELTEEFAPYIGVSHERLLGDTADLARISGQVVESTQLVIGFSSTF